MTTSFFLSLQEYHCDSVCGIPVHSTNSVKKRWFKTRWMTWRAASGRPCRTGITRITTGCFACTAGACARPLFSPT